jgi:signal transduction histidine kinase
MSSSLELQSVLKVVTSELQRLVGAESVSVLLRDSDELVFAAATGPGADELIGTRMPATAGIAGAVLQSQTPAISTHAQADQRFYTAIDKQTGLATQTILAVPLAHDGRAIGVMEAINKAPTSSLQVTEVESFGGHDLDLMVAIAGSAAIAIENARLYEAQREHNRRLQAAQPQLIQTEKMAALGRLAASLSHEINNPLQAVQGCLNLMDEAFKSAGPLGRDAQTELQQDLQIAISEFDRVANIVRRLRALYYAAPAQPATTDVPVQIELVLDLAAQALADRLITVERHYALDEVGDLRVAADPDRFRHVLLTLVLSAIDSMPEGGTLSLEAGRDSRAIPGVRIAVGDTGPQIPAEMLPRLFEPFQVVRAHDSSLGLSISYELIASLGGELTAENRPDAGMTITIWLPSGPEEDFDG